VPSPPSTPALRVITDPEAVASLASDRQSWAALWEAIAQETAAAPADEERPDDEAA
jgi:hypothetical protein